jgi:hypothetical protein
MERRALARVREQRPESFGLVALDSPARPLESSHMILERGSHRIQVRCAQLLVSRLRVLVWHANSLPCRVRAYRCGAGEPLLTE